MGNSESQPVRNVDKRTARRDHAHIFKGAITTYRREVLLNAAPDCDAREGLIHDPGDALRVAVRRRPFFKHELDQGEFDVVSCEKRSISVHDCRLHADCRRAFVEHLKFRFDRVFDEAADSLVVYAESVTPLVERACTTARASTVLMYGQTGSGKTFTMRAIFAAAAEEIFRTIDAGAGDYVTVCFSELNGTGARDMLNKGANASMLTDACGDVQVVPSLEVMANDAAGLLALIEYASALRATHATGVHDASSRSHAICRIGIQRATYEKGQSGSLTLVDLAGSEQRIDTDKHDARRTKESAFINSSLMSLKDSVRALARGEEFGQLAGRSSLTKLLKPSFTGKESQTLVLATISPAAKDTEHTLNTLRHACVMDGRPTDDGKSWISGGESHKQDIGEIDVKATKAKLKADEAKAGGGRRPGSGNTNSGGGGDGAGGFGYGGGAGDGVGAEAARAMAARKEEARVKSEDAKRQRKAIHELEQNNPDQHAALLDARNDAASRGNALNPHQAARIRFRQKEEYSAVAEEAAKMQERLISDTGCEADVAKRAVQALGPVRPHETASHRLQVAKELLHEAQEADAARKQAAAMSADERRALKEAKLEASREAENKRRGRKAYLESLPHWERDKAEVRLKEEDEAQRAYEEGRGPKPRTREEQLQAEAEQTFAASAEPDAPPMTAAEKKAARTAAAAERRQAADEQKKAATQAKIAAREAREAQLQAEAQARVEQMGGVEHDGGDADYSDYGGPAQRGGPSHAPPPPPQVSELDQLHARGDQKFGRGRLPPQQLFGRGREAETSAATASSGFLPAIGGRGTASTNEFDAREDSHGPPSQHAQRAGGGGGGGGDGAVERELTAEEKDSKRVAEHEEWEAKRLAEYDRAAAARMADYESGGFGAPPPLPSKKVKGKGPPPKSVGRRQRNGSDSHDVRQREVVTAPADVSPSATAHDEHSLNLNPMSPPAAHHHQPPRQPEHQMHHQSRQPASPARLSQHEAEHMRERLDELAATSPHHSAHGRAAMSHPPPPRQNGFTQAKLSAAEMADLEYEAEMLELEREGALPSDVTRERQAQRAAQQAMHEQQRQQVVRQKAAAMGAAAPPPLRRTTPFGSRSRPGTARTPGTSRPESAVTAARAPSIELDEPAERYEPVRYDDDPPPRVPPQRPPRNDDEQPPRAPPQRQTPQPQQRPSSRPPSHTPSRPPSRPPSQPASQPPPPPPPAPPPHSPPPPPQQPPPPQASPPSPHEHVLEPTDKDVRLKQAAQRRAAAEEARRAQLVAKQQAKQGRGAASLVEGHAHGQASPDADATAAVALEPTEKDKRMATAAQRRQAAEEARKAELVSKQRAKADKREAPDADHEVLRIELLLEQCAPGRAGDASRAGLKKQMAAAKAGAVREERRREQAEREAKKASEAAARAAAQAAAARAEQQDIA